MFMVWRVASGIDDFPSTKNITGHLQSSGDSYLTIQSDLSGQADGVGLRRDRTIGDHRRAAADLNGHRAAG